MKRSRWSLAAAVLGAAVVAELAVLVLRPRHGVIRPVAVAEHSYFSEAQIERARRFRHGQLALLLAGMAVQGGLLVFLVLRPGHVERFCPGARPIVAGGLAGAGLVVALQVVALPLDAIGHQRSVAFRLSTQGWDGWLADQAKVVAVAGAFAGVGATVLLGLMRRFGRRWWMPAAAGAIALDVLLAFLAPVVLAPLFNRFTPLRAGRERQQVLELARRADVRVGEVFVADASRRTTASNAYVAGLGRTKRVVLYDTLLRDFPDGERRLVVAHELGHVARHDVPYGILFAALVTPFGMLVVQRLVERWAERSGRVPGSVGSVPALALAVALVSFGAQLAGNQLSRRMEARADTFALQLTGEPREAIAMERRLALSNLVDPNPPAPLVWLFGSHPPVVERIGAAEAFARGER